MKRSLGFFLLSVLIMEGYAQPYTSTEHLTYYAFRLKPHQDLKQGIQSFAKENSIKAGTIITCVGSLEKTNFRYANQKNGTVMSGHFEIISLVGTFSDSSMHVHISVADQEGKTSGGHLLDGNLIYTTAEIVVAELAGLEFVRESDDTYGYKELVIKKKIEEKK